MAFTAHRDIIQVQGFRFIGVNWRAQAATKRMPRHTRPRHALRCLALGWEMPTPWHLLIKMTKVRSEKIWKADNCWRHMSAVCRSPRGKVSPSEACFFLRKAASAHNSALLALPASAAQPPAGTRQKNTLQIACKVKRFSCVAAWTSQPMKELIRPKRRPPRKHNSVTQTPHRTATACWESSALGSPPFFLNIYTNTWAPLS